MGSCATNTEAVISQIIDTFPTLRTKKKEMAFRCCFVLSLFLLGPCEKIADGWQLSIHLHDVVPFPFVGLPMICSSGGMQLLELDDNYCTGINSYICGITMCVILGYLYGIKNFVQVDFPGEEDCLFSAFYTEP